MNIYEVNSYYYNTTECDYIGGSTYLVHEKNFTQDEFKNLCGQLLEETNRSHYDMCKILIEKHGFKYLVPTARFEFNQDGDEE